LLTGEVNAAVAGAGEGRCAGTLAKLQRAEHFPERQTGG
jgi:hypothetical protein